jgi:Pyruvate/2-oxoacid:ferredoxin oxidoreductase gamma subunit
MLTEIRWHGRAGQGAKTASQLLALALLRSGYSVQAFPEYGPERRGAPVRAYTRVSDRPIDRHDSVDSPDVVAVLDPSLLHEDGVVDDAARLLVNPGGLENANLRVAGQVAAAIGIPPLEALQDAAVEVLGRKRSGDAIRAAVEEGYRWPS